MFIDGHFYNRIYEPGSENNTAVVAVETHTIHKIEEGIGKSFCYSGIFDFSFLGWDFLPFVPYIFPPTQYALPVLHEFDDGASRDTTD